MANLPTTAEVANPAQLGYDAAIDDFLVRFAPIGESAMRIVTAQTGDQERLGTEQTPEDFASTFGTIFSRNSFAGGQGLDFALRTDRGDTDASRFWDSQGIDISATKPGVLDGFQALHATEELWASTEQNIYVARLPDDTVLFAEDDTVWAVDLPLDPTPSRSAEDPHSGSQAVTGLVVLGDRAFAAVGTDGVGIRSSVGVWSDAAAPPGNVLGLWAVKARLIADIDGIVAVLDDFDASPTTVITLASGVTVNDICDAGPVILVACSDGSLYALTDDAGTLVVVNQTQITNTDVVTCMASIAGVLVFGTTDGNVGRLWRAVVMDAQQNHAIGDTVLMKELPYTPQAAHAVRDKVYLAVRRSNTEVELWRFQAESAGLARDLIFEVGDPGDPVAVTSVDDVLFVGIGGIGFSRQHLTEYVPQAWLISPMTDHFSPDQKAWIGLTTYAEQLTDGASIDLLVSTDPAALMDYLHSSWVQVGRLTNQSQTGTEMSLPSILGRYGAVQVRLNAGVNNEHTARFVSFALRSYADSEDLIVVFQVNVSDTIERHHRRPLRTKGWGLRVWKALLGYDGRYVLLQLYREALTMFGVVEEIGTPVIGRSLRGSRTLSSQVSVRGRIVQAGSTIAGDGTLGVGLAGVALAGVEN